MKILVLNCGSSSIKYQLFEMPAREVLAKGGVERIGEAESVLSQESSRGTLSATRGVPDHRTGLDAMVGMLTDPDHGPIRSMHAIGACGHRVVHGGEDAGGSCLIDDALEAVIERHIDLAPLHNPPNLTGIRAARAVLGEVPQVACFDTAFHQTLPEAAYHYALPYELYERFRIRRYGFHGTSHQCVTQKAAAQLGRPVDTVSLITCHLGNGCSITAVRDGCSVDTSMGLTPLEGVMMGTRCGDIDPAIPLFLLQHGYDAAGVDRLLNKESGLAGLSGVSNDLRDVMQAAAAGNARAELALQRYAYSVRKYIGAYLAVLNGCDAIVFTAGVGQHSAAMRRRILEHLEALGIVLDPQRNAALDSEGGSIQAADSRVAILVIPTDEEGMIAEETYNLTKGEAR